VDGLLRTGDMHETQEYSSGYYKTLLRNWSKERPTSNWNAGLVFSLIFGDI
jgi:hypothetical protein